MRKYTLPGCLAGKCSQSKYSKWLGRKAQAHLKRDRHRQTAPKWTLSQYKTAIHTAVVEGGDRDFYTGEPLDWSLISTFENKAAKAGGSKYKQTLRMLPTVDHCFDEKGQPRLVICSYEVNDAKSNLPLQEFYRLCESVLRHRDRRIKLSTSIVT